MGGGQVVATVMATAITFPQGDCSVGEEISRLLMAYFKYLSVFPSPDYHF